MEKDLISLRRRLNQALDDQHVFLESKSHVKWLKDGDRNTNIFHAAAKVRRSANQFRVTLADGSLSDNRDVVGSMAVSFFQSLLGGFSAVPNHGYFGDISPSISISDNENLTKMPSSDEIWEAVCNLPKDSAPGPDGYTGRFFQACWDTIGNDVTNAIMLFFRGGQLPASISSTVLTLIPKVKNATSLDQVRPISLCNFIHKIISKILNDRLRPFLDKIISTEQFGFIPGRSIHQCIALAHDLTSDINNKVHGGNVMLKLDMSKAYDRVSWLFLIRAMRALGFNEAWCDLIYRNISNCWYSIRVSGKSFGHFKSNRGLRQGDPLSPSLFILAMEILTQKLNSAGRTGGGVMPYWSSLRALEINHIMYADDILIFTNGGKSSFSNLLKVLEDFCSNSGQVLQPAKCKLFTSKHIKSSRREHLLRTSGYTSGTFPIRYLGAPLFYGQPKLRYFQGLVDAVKLRIEGWMKSFLSMAGRITLIKSVLMSIPIHTLSVLSAPKGIVEDIDKLLRSFLWGSRGSARHHWVNWDKICTDLGNGGLGIRPLGQVMSGLKGKMAWNFLCNKSLWARHARSRYVIGKNGSHLWKTISPYISGIALDSHWKLGNGSTSVAVFCQNLSMPFPRRLRSKSIKEVMTNPNVRRIFIQNMNPCIFTSLDGRFEEMLPDRLVWGNHPSGIVTTKTYINYCHPPSPMKGVFGVIWQTWLPPKVSCFLWKILHGALPTNDNVVRLGISLASICVCCKVSGCETTEHLFLYSDMASILWDFVCPIFKKPKPASIRSFIFDWGVSGDLSNFSDVMAFGMVSMCLWEIWKVRNDFVYGDQNTKFSRYSIIRAAQSISLCLPKKCSRNFKSRRICLSLCIPQAEVRSFSIFWVRWEPYSHGNSCNMGICVTSTAAKISAIVRDHGGNLVFALRVCSTSKHFLKCVLYALHEIRRHQIDLTCLYASNEGILHLGRNSDVEWPIFQIKRRLVKDLSNVFVSLVCPALNRPAEALCFSNVGYLCSSRVEDLPPSVARALYNDSFPQPCAFLNQRVYL